MHRTCTPIHRYVIYNMQICKQTHICIYIYMYMRMCMRMHQDTCIYMHSYIRIYIMYMYV